MPTEQRYGIPATVIHQTVDRETVIINLENGRYYSLNPSGSLMWLELLASSSPAEISAALVRVHPASADAIPDQIDTFISELGSQDLLTPIAADAPLRPIDPAFLAMPYSPPQLTTFTDMEHLIPLDPIHQVGALGWPHKADQ